MKKISIDEAMLLASTYKATGLYSQAIDVLQEIIADHPDFAAAYNNLGTVYYAQDKLHDAIGAYQRAIEIQSDYIDAYYNLGLALNKAKRRQEAMHAFRALLEMIPSHAGARFQLGSIFMLLANYQAAIEQFTQILRVHPFHFETQANLATCYLRVGWYDQAKTHYQKALEIVPDDLQVLFNLGVISMAQGHPQTAIDYYQRVINLSPDDFNAHNNLAVAALALKNSELALTHYREAVRIQPMNEAVRHAMHIIMQNQSLSASPPDYIRTLFDAYADHYDVHLTQSLHYQVPELILQALKAAGVGNNLCMLDLGCGTGLCGVLLKPCARHLVGIDLSEKMLAVAQSKHVYDELHLTDILAFLADKKAQYDVIVAGDVLVYFGDLAAVFAAVQHALVPNGLFIFNAEISVTAAYIMTTSGRFAHSEQYIDQLAQRSRMHIMNHAAIVMRTQNDEAVRGHLYTLSNA